MQSPKYIPHSIKLIVLSSFVFLMTACQATDSASAPLTSESTEDSHILFEDTMTENWEANWFVDGDLAVLEHQDGGLLFHSPTSGVSQKDKNKYREKFDAHHAVLWTHKEFAGDIRISYEFTRMETDWANLIYIQAQGIGKPPYDEDIYAWRELRGVSSMDKYFNYMNLLSLSLRDEIRCKRYPWSDVAKDYDYEDTLVKPMVDHEGLPDGKTYSVVIEKRKKSCLLQIREQGRDEYIVNYTWDLSDPSRKRKQPYVENGRIGFRQMGGNKVLYKNFKVEQL